MDQDSNHLIHVNGTSLYAIKEGKGDAIVFMHGFGLDHRMWKNQIKTLSRHFTVISYDLRGFGKSMLPEDRTPYKHEDDYLALLKHFGIDRAHLVGSSMGGRMAIRCGLTCQHAVSSLILLDSALDGFQWSIQWQEEWNNMVAAGAEDLNRAKELWMQHSLFSRANTHADIASELKSMIADYSAWHCANKDPAIVPEPPSIERLSQITLPTLVVVGEYDTPDFQEIANTLCSKIFKAKRLEVPQSGHMVNMESPEFLHAEILKFLNRI